MTSTLSIQPTIEGGSYELVRQKSRRKKGSSRICYVVFGMSVGVFLVAVSFAASRANFTHANIVYWLGEFLFFGVPAAYLLTRRPNKKQSALLAVATPILSYAITEAYSPVQFRFLDEFQNVQTAQAILSTHHLFASNTSLPVSPYFPGLEIATTSLVQLAHLSIDASGTIVVGIAHLLTAFGLYLLVMEIYNRPRIAALAVIIYATEPHYQFFDSYFVYETMAMPFLIACLLAYVKMMKAEDLRDRAAWFGFAILTAFATVVSHHITSYVLFGSLALLTVIEVVRRQPPVGRLRWAGAVAVAVLLLIAGWDLGVAHGVVTYLQSAAQSITGAFSAATAVGITKGGSGLAVNAPERDVVAEYASTALLLGLITLGLGFTWRNSRLRKGRFRLAFILLSSTIYVVVLLRLVASDGGEVAGRSYSFVMIPGSVACAIALERLFVERRVRAVRHRKHGRIGFSPGVGVVCVLVLLAGGIAGGWPPYYARLPGPFLAGAWERSVDSHNLLAAEWAAQNLPKGSGVASDWVTGALMGSLGHLGNDPGTALLFLTTRFEPQLRSIVAERRVRYVVVDIRILNHTPQNGIFFRQDPFAGHYQGGLRLKQALNKFDNARGVSKIYSDGTISIYDLTGSQY